MRDNQHVPAHSAPTQQAGAQLTSLSSACKAISDGHRVLPKGTVNARQEYEGPRLDKKN